MLDNIVISFVLKVIIGSLIHLFLVPICYFDAQILKISLHLKIIFLILYILLYIFSPKKYKKYLLTLFIILYLYFAYFVVGKVLSHAGM